MKYLNILSRQLSRLGWRKFQFRSYTLVTRIRWIDIGMPDAKLTVPAKGMDVWKKLYFYVKNVLWIYK